MEIKTKLIESTFYLPECPHGYGNGYIAVPPEHPWFKKDYNDIDCNVHGGLTYSGDHAPKEAPDGYWWIGFDTAHLDDNKHNCSKNYCESEIESLKQQALAAILTSDKPL